MGTADGAGHAEGGEYGLAALGLAEAPRDHPLSYPGAWPTRSGLLDGDRLLPLEGTEFPGRTPVLAIGSNASPGQLRHKMDAFGLTAPLPMLRVRVTGLDVGVSAHISLHGYVSASPVHSPGTVRKLYVIWPDPAQLAAVDATEPHFDRARLPDEIRVQALGPEGGARLLPGVGVYVNRHGVLRDGSGAPRAHPGQRALITELLAGSAGLRELFGTTPEEFCARARADAERCARGTGLLADEGRVTRSGLEHLVRGGAETA
ncbi:hypothetical protein ACFWNK_12540 [Streptomyces sp. NPDC058417]|uniref:hypothetical protein n=1 Tax=unclassified Streptomyces TaxID=2593676 RepID=UPI00365CF3B2